MEKLSLGNSAFADVKCEKPDFVTISEGEHIGVIRQAALVNSFMKDLKGTMKTDLPEWITPTTQIALVLQAVGKTKGITTTRINRNAYLKWNDLSQEEKASGKYTPDENEKYALVETKDGKFDRVVDEEGTKKCISIINQLGVTLGADPGTPLEKAINDAIEDGCVFKFKVKSEKYKGKTVTSVSSIYPISEDEYEAFLDHVEKEEKAA